MKNSIKITQLFLLLIFLTSCKSTANKQELIIDSEEKKSVQTKLSKSKMEVRYSCGEDGISDFLNDGWIISKEYTEEKICTWKSFPATKDCDMEKDKGCKITTPDKIGEEKVYLLEKQLKIMPNKKEYLLEVIFNKLKKNSKNINLEKKEFIKFINLLINDN